MDFGFKVQKSKNKNRYDSLKGINDETYYLVIKDTFTGCKYGEAFINKIPPTQSLRFFFEQHAPDKTSTNNMRICVDKGGELGMSHEFRRVCHLFGYVIDDIAPDSSSENGAVEVANRDIGASLRSLLKGAGMPFKYWPYDFRHVLIIERYMTPSN